MSIVGRLASDEPVFTRSVDVLIVGSGIAGLGLAQALAGDGLSVEVVTKLWLRDGSTRWAQGGVATADAPGDHPESHLYDTLVAGAGLCDVDAVRILVQEGPSAVAGLLASGAVFDRTEDGRLSYTLEGGHSRARIVHAGGDATGLEIQRTLESVVTASDDIRVTQRTFLLDLLQAPDGAVAGARVSQWTGDPDHPGEIGEIHARATVLATGGYGQVFAKTSNPVVATGDGLAAAMRAGAETADVEFVQFHPTVLAIPSVADDAGRQLLVSEAVRGEGAVLIDADGNRVMAGKHPREDLAPRDVVAAVMAERMAELGVDHLYLDARHIGEAKLLKRFPTIVAGCRSAGIDPVTQPIPVAPAAHYACGGIRSDMSGRTSLRGLYALGEVAQTGVHGANRLASNSLLEAMVVARRLAVELGTALPPAQTPAPDPRRQGRIDPQFRDALREAMVRRAGVVRRPEELTELKGYLAGLADVALSTPGSDLLSWETTNLHTIATALVQAAAERAESRGCHRRDDAPERVEQWRRRLIGTAHEGRITLTPTEILPAAADPEAHAEPPLIAPLPPGEAQRLAQLTLTEDLDGGIDITSEATINADATGIGDLVARAAGVVSGIEVARAVFAAVDPSVRFEPGVIDGAVVEVGTVIATVEGSTRSILTAERSALNLLCLMSGTATLTARWVAAVAGTGAVIRDSRKTTPGLRQAQKYAVRCGGGQNHRMSLGDQALIKDNHVIAAGGVVAALDAVRALAPEIPCEVECTTLEEVDQVATAGAELILLDNMSIEQMRSGVELARAHGAKTEASGGLRLENAREVAETGVDYLAIGALTHSAPVLDIALDLR